MNPNPIDNQLNILGEFSRNKYTCTIYDALGQKVKRINNLSAVNDTNKLIIPDLADLNIGVYVIYLTENNKVFKGKFIKD
jgi:hypothetical protein